MATEEKKVIDSRAYFCSDSSCQVHWVADAYDGAGYGSVILACACIKLEKEELLALSETDLQETYDAKIHFVDVDDPDTIDNVRPFQCSGMKCRITYGDGLHAHCESCYSHLIHFLRRERAEQAEVATTEGED